MKINFGSIRFNIWLYFCLFSLVILVLFGLLQGVLIRPYYRNSRLDTIVEVAANLERLLLDDDSAQADNVEKALDVIVDNGLCVSIINAKGEEVYANDALGNTCIFYSTVEIDGESFDLRRDKASLNSLVSQKDPLSLSVLSPVSKNEMLLEGERINSKFGSYYLYINSPLEPIESVVNFIFNQFLYIALFVLGVGIVISLFVSRRITYPIIKIKKEADKLTNGNYDADFKVNSYSEINELAQTLNDATKQLSQTDELRNDLIANVSHDIKTPLTMIKAYSEMIKDISGDDPQKRNEHLDVIIEEVNYLDKLVADMASLSKMQAGVDTLKKTNFDLKAAVLEITKLYDGLFKEHSINLKLDLERVFVYGDELKLKQVIANFISNAIKYSKDGTNITLLLRQDEDVVHFEVSDEGEGIDEEDLPYVWDRYYKKDRRFHREVASSGLGLAIAKTILEAHGAKYGVISKKGEGSTFYFEISRDYENETD